MLQKRENFVLVLQIFVFKCCKHFTLIASRLWQVVQAVAMAESIAICQYLLRTDFPPESNKAGKGRVGTSGEHLFQIYRRLIGRTYIALARQDKIYRNISVHSGGSDQT